MDIVVIIGLVAALALSAIGALKLFGRSSRSSDAGAEPDASPPPGHAEQAEASEPPPAPAPAPAVRRKRTSDTRASAEPPEEILGASDVEEETAAGSISSATEAACTFFAPPSVAAEETFLIQVWLHQPRAAARVRELAALTDNSGTERPSVALAAPLERDQLVEIRIDAPELALDEPVQTVAWNGDHVFAHIQARAPQSLAGRSAFARIRLFSGAVPLGSGVLRVAVREPGLPAIGGAVEAGARWNRTAFLSYAREDLDTVLEHHQSLAAAGIDVMHDLLTLSPGDRWERELQAHIARCDVFLLYWSSAAARSEFVLKEAEWALNRQRVSGDGSPDIIPVVLETPPPSPPPALAHLHFDDHIRRLILSAD